MISCMHESTTHHDCCSCRPGRAHGPSRNQGTRWRSRQRTNSSRHPFVAGTEGSTPAALSASWQENQEELTMRHSLRARQRALVARALRLAEDLAVAQRAHDHLWLTLKPNQKLEGDSNAITNRHHQTANPGNASLESGARRPRGARTRNRRYRQARHVETLAVRRRAA